MSKVLKSTGQVFTRKVSGDFVTLLSKNGKFKVVVLKSKEHLYVVDTEVKKAEVKTAEKAFSKLNHDELCAKAVELNLLTDEDAKAKTKAELRTFIEENSEEVVQDGKKTLIAKLKEKVGL